MSRVPPFGALSSLCFRCARGYAIRFALLLRAVRQGEHRRDRCGTSFYARGILRTRLVEAADTFGQGVRDLRRRASQDLQEAWHSYPAAWLVGKEGSREEGGADAIAESQSRGSRQ